MPVTMNIQNLTSITSLDQLKVGSDNQLQMRSSIGTSFRRLGDALLSLSQAGRSSITQRNDRILQGMRLVVEQAALTIAAEDRPMAERLSSALDRIKTATANVNSNSFDELKGAAASLEVKAGALKHGLYLDPDFNSLSVSSQRGLLHALDTIDIDRHGLIPDKQGAIEQLKKDFYGIRRDDYDIEAGMRKFGDSMVTEFLKPTQQNDILDGIHFSFLKDANRHSIVSFNGYDIMPGGLAPQSSLLPENFDEYKTIIKNVIPEKHHKFLPFITMMASQAGVDCAKSFLPHLTNASTPGHMHLITAGIVPKLEGTMHPLTIELDGDNLRITNTFAEPYTTFGNPIDSTTVIICKGQVTMNIDLAADPLTKTVNGKEVILPQFTIESGDVHFETP